MKNIIIGTAGHIDHGKTTLIRALTGRNTDRLKEEKERGITIELGFTWFDMKDGTRCGIIDVPGHEKFINNMVAGVVGMDLVLLVVAADEGIMPQTREHLDILELLGIENVILVINKCDLVDAEWLEMVEEEIKEELKGTIVENAPVVKVSSATGEGIEALKDEIAKMQKELSKEKDENGIARLPIDRVFSLTGFGTVVTGTLLSGKIQKGESFCIYPSQKECKVRNIQVHEKDQDRCSAGQRVALNLVGVRKEDLHRGAVIAPQGSMKNTDRIDVRMSVLKDSSRTLTNRERLHLFTGTSEVLCRAVLLDQEEIAPGQSGFCQLLLEEEIVVKRGDHFIVRFYSPLETVGGGVILEPNPRKKKRFHEDVIEELERKESGSLADVCALHIQSEMLMTLTKLTQLMSHSKEEILPYLEELEQEGKIIKIDMKREIYYWHIANKSAFEEELKVRLLKYHQNYPYRFGMKKAEVYHSLMKQIKPNVFEECLLLLVKEKFIRLVDEFVCLNEFKIVKDQTYIKVECTVLDALKMAGYDLIKYTEISGLHEKEEEVLDIFHLMSYEKKLVRLSDEIYTLKSLIDDLHEKIEEYFEKNEVLTIAQVRDMCNTSRKCAKILIEYFDEQKFTKKVGAETERVHY